MVDVTDGTYFIGIDGDAFVADEPLDAALEQQLWSNQMYLSVGRNSCTNTWYSGESTALNTSDGHRPHVCLNYMSVFAIPLKVRTGLESISVRGIYNVQSEGDVQADMDYKLVLYKGLQAIDETTGTFTNTDNAGVPSFEDFSITLTLEEPREEQDTLRLVLWVRSQEGGTGATAELSLLTGSNYALITETNNAISQPSPSPADGDPTIFYLRDPTTLQPYEVWGVDPNAASGELVWIRPNASNITDYVSATAFPVNELSYMQIRSATVALTYDNNSQSTFRQAQLAAQQAPRGRQEGTHAQALLDLYRAPRLCGWGPAGKVSTRDESWPSGYAEWWNYALGDGSRDTLVDQLVRFDVDNPTVEVVMYLIPTAFSAQAGYDFNTQKEVRDAAGAADWDITLTVSQLEDGDTAWSTASYSQDNSADSQTLESAPLYPTSARSPFPFLYTTHLLHAFGDVTDASAGGFEELAYCTREGMIAESDTELIQVFSTTLALTDFDEDTSPSRIQRPARVQVTASLGTVSSRPFSYLGSGVNGQYRLTCVGYSIFASK